MLKLHEFNALSNVAKSEYLRENFPVNAMSRIRRKPVDGVGFNDANYIATPRIDGNRVVCPAYRAWASMINRSYSQKYQDEHPTYVGVTVFSEWLSFMAFRAWWMSNQVDGWQLDKDILGDSREYGPESCIFVPSWLNSFTADSGSARGDCPIGVSWRKDKGKHQAMCRHPFRKLGHVGYFDSADDAHAAWLASKLEIAAELKPRMDEIDMRIYTRVVEIISRAK